MSFHTKYETSVTKSIPNKEGRQVFYFSKKIDVTPFLSGISEKQKHIFLKTTLFSS